MEHEHADDHDALSCPQCQAASAQCQALGGFAEGMQKMLDDGTFERMGALAGWEQERQVMLAVTGQDIGPMPPDHVAPTPTEGSK